MPKYEQVALLVEQQIAGGRFAPGERIYSIRELSEQFRVGDVTAKAAMRRLIDKGVVRTVVGSGAYVQERPVDDRAEQASAQGQDPGRAKLQSKTIGFLKAGLGSAPIFALGIDLVQQELQRDGFSVLSAVVEEGDEPAMREAMQRFVGQGVEALLVFPRHGQAVRESTGVLAYREWPGPRLMLESRTSEGDYVTADLERMTDQLVQYCYELGHRHICLATTFARKVAGFERAARRLPDLQTSVLGEPGKTDAATHELAEQILSMQPRPTAVIAADDHAAAICIMHFQHAGLRVPEDISVAAYNDHPVDAQKSPVAVTMSAHPVREVAQEVVQWVQQQIQGSKPRPFRREIAGALIGRASTGLPPVNPKQEPQV